MTTYDNVRSDAMVAKRSEEPDDLVTVRQAANVLRVSESTVWRWINDGRLTSYRVGPKRIWLRRNELNALKEPRSNARTPKDDDVRRYLRPMAPESHKMTTEELEVHFNELMAEIEELKRQGKPLWNSADAINEAREEYSGVP